MGSHRFPYRDSVTRFLHTILPGKLTLAHAELFSNMVSISLRYFFFKVKIIDSVVSSTLLSQNLDLHVDQQHLEIVF